jgi:Tol biopolymer transport system component/imidazolonepropionase-like amidohydrolase
MPLQRLKSQQEKRGVSQVSPLLWQAYIDLNRIEWCSMKNLSTVAAISLATAAISATPPPVEITVHEGTSMSVAVSPDGSMLAIDLQGSIWTLPSTGGTAERITDLFNDARQPVWSPDGKWIAFMGYREGNYSIEAVAPDGSNKHKLTWGPFDDREPAWSHDGTRLAFSSDRGTLPGGSYNIWVLDLRNGDLRQRTRNGAENRMPSWSPDDTEIAFSSTRENGQSVWAETVGSGVERKVFTGAGAIDAPSWGPGGTIVYHAGSAGASQLAADGKPLTGGENAFPFRVSWTSPADFYYTSDGKIRKRSVSGGDPRTIEFTATLRVTRAQYPRRKRDFGSTVPRQALGIVHPVLSPDGAKVAFAALGDIWVMNLGGKPENLTKDKYFDTDPAWSPDGRQLVYSSDKGGRLLQLWIRDMGTGRERQITNLKTQPLGAAWSPDGKRIAFFDVNAMWGEATLSVVDVASGEVTKIHDSLFGPGAPTWSRDGERVAVAMLAPYSKSFREGTNQVLTVSTRGTHDEKWFAPVPNLSIDSRTGSGPVWSPDGTRMAGIYEGFLAVWPVSLAGEPLGPPRRVTRDMAHSPSWSGDSRHILYQSIDGMQARLKVADLETGETRIIPLDLKYTPAIPAGRTVVHAGLLVDGRSPAARSNIDIVIEGNRIRAVAPHRAANHLGAKLVDATGLAVMPGLIEYHTHLQSDYGGAEHRAWLAFGVTTVRSPGGAPYEAVEDREANEAGVRPGPRIFATGYLMEWQRLYYKVGVAVSSPAHLEMELERARVLQHDLIKSYVRLPDLQQKRVVEFAHGIGIPVASHEIYPAAFVGVDTVEHTGATSRRGYSPKIATLQRSYEDVIQILGRSASFFCPMIIGPGTQKLLADDAVLRTDPRLDLYPDWVRAQLQAPAGRGGRGGVGGSGQMVMAAMKAGARIVAGTDTPNALNLHGELMSYVMAGMTPFEALRAATVNPAEALALDAGIIEPGKLADLVIVEGNPLEDISNAHKVRRVIANGRLFEMDELLSGRPATH